MTHRVELRPAAAREVRKLDRSARERISKVISLLADEPRPPAAKSLTGDDTPWRVRTGDHRVVYSVEGDVLLVLVINVRHRREAYGR